MWVPSLAIGLAEGLQHGRGPFKAGTRSTGGGSVELAVRLPFAEGPLTQRLGGSFGSQHDAHASLSAGYALGRMRKQWSAHIER